MNMSLRIVITGLVLLPLAAGCDDKKPTGDAPSATAPSSVPAVTASATAEPAEAASAPAAPAGSSASSMLTGDAKDVVLTM
jgi:hypothetical protein